MESQCFSLLELFSDNKIPIDMLDLEYTCLNSTVFTRCVSVSLDFISTSGYIQKVTLKNLIEKI